MEKREMKKKIIIGYTNSSQIKDLKFQKYLREEGWLALHLRKSNLYVDTMATMASEVNGGGFVWKEDKELKKYKITIERIK
jgi:hypothetical protein